MSYEDDLDTCGFDFKSFEKFVNESFYSTETAGDNFHQSHESTARRIEETCEELIASFLFDPSPQEVTSDTENVFGNGGEKGEYQRDAAITNDCPVDNIAALHEGLIKCNTNLVEMQSSLREFHERLLAACSEINVLRVKAAQTKLMLNNRVAVQRIISRFIQSLIVPPDVVHVLLSSSSSSFGLGSAGGVVRNVTESTLTSSHVHSSTSTYSSTGTSLTALTNSALLLQESSDYNQGDLGAQFLSAIRLLHQIVRKRLHINELRLDRNIEMTQKGGVSMNATRSSMDNNINTSPSLSPMASRGEQDPTCPTESLRGEKRYSNTITDDSLRSSSIHDLALELRKSKKFRELAHFTQDLLIFACIRIRGFLAAKIHKSLSNPRTNFVAQQEYVMRSYRCLTRFMRDAVEYLRVTTVLSSTVSVNDNTTTNKTSPPEDTVAKVNSQIHPVAGVDHGLQLAPGEALASSHQVTPRKVTQKTTPTESPSVRGGGKPIPSHLLLAQRGKPFVPYRLIKALYDDLKQQYRVTMAKVYCDRIQGYLKALSALELGGGESCGISRGSMFGSGTGGYAGVGGSSSVPPTGGGGWGITSYLFGGPSISHSQTSKGPTRSEHLAAYRSKVNPQLIGTNLPKSFVYSGFHDRPPFSGSSSRQDPSVNLELQRGELQGLVGGPRLPESSEDLSDFSLGLRGSIFQRTIAGTSGGSPSVQSVPSQLNDYSQSSRFVGLFGPPVIPHLARMNARFQTYEESYRSIHALLHDIVSHEFLFLLDMFGPDSWGMTLHVFQRAMQLIIDHTSDRLLLNQPHQYLLSRDTNNNKRNGSSVTVSQVITDTAFSPFVAGNKDLPGLLVLFRTTVIFKANMHFVRRLNILDSFYDSHIALLQPAILAALDNHVMSLRSLNSPSDNTTDNSHQLSDGSSLLCTLPFIVSAPQTPSNITEITNIHPLAFRYAAMTGAVMQLIDLSFLLRLQRVRNIEDMCYTSSSTTGQHRSDPTCGVGIQLPGGPSYSSSRSNEVGGFSDELVPWLTVLRAKLSALRLEVVRLLRVPCLPYLSFYSPLYMLAYLQCEYETEEKREKSRVEGRGCSDGVGCCVINNNLPPPIMPPLCPEYHQSKAGSTPEGSKGKSVLKSTGRKKQNGVYSHTFLSSRRENEEMKVSISNNRATEEKNAMAAVVPNLNSLHYIISNWESSLVHSAAFPVSDKPTECLSSNGLHRRTCSDNPLYAGQGTELAVTEKYIHDLYRYVSIQEFTTNSGNGNSVMNYSPEALVQYAVFDSCAALLPTGLDAELMRLREGVQRSLTAAVEDSTAAVGATYKCENSNGPFGSVCNNNAATHQHYDHTHINPLFNSTASPTTPQTHEYGPKIPTSPSILSVIIDSRHEDYSALKQELMIQKTLFVKLAIHVCFPSVSKMLTVEALRKSSSVLGGSSKRPVTRCTALGIPGYTTWDTSNGECDTLETALGFLEFLIEKQSSRSDCCCNFAGSSVGNSDRSLGSRKEKVRLDDSSSGDDSESVSEIKNNEGGLYDIDMGNASRSPEAVAERLLSICAMCRDIIEVCTDYTKSWKEGLYRLRAMIPTYVPYHSPPVVLGGGRPSLASSTQLYPLQQELLARACTTVLDNNSTMSRRVPILNSIVKKIHFLLQLMDASNEDNADTLLHSSQIQQIYAAVPPVVGTMRGLIVSDQHLVQIIRTFEVGDMLHNSDDDQHPDL